MIDEGEAYRFDICLGARRRGWDEIHIVNRALAVAVHEVDQTAADALDGWNVELHRSRRRGTCLCSEREGARIRIARVGDSKGHGAGARAMGAGKLLRKTVVLRVDDEVDVALIVQGHVLRTMPRNRPQAHAFEQTTQQFRIRRGVLDEFEAVGAHRIGGAQLEAHDDTVALPRTLMAVPKTWSHSDVVT